jgi:CDGSH-type Zn-finger protein
MTVKISARARGPLILEHDGEVELQILRCDGSRVDVSDLETIRLCRCGASACAPLCDGAHNRIRFEAPTVKVDGGD